MLRKLFFFSWFSIFISESSGMATLAHTPESMSLCKTAINDNGWSINGVGRKINGVVYSFTVEDQAGWKRKTPLEGMPLDGVHWIFIEVSAGVPANEVGVSVKGKPVIYDPREAELEVNGKTFKAFQKIWKSEFNDPSPPLSIDIPTNLNIEGKKHYPYFIIAFPAEIKINPKTEYIFRPGTVFLDGVRYPLPVYKSCYTPGKWWWNPIN